MSAPLPHSLARGAEHLHALGPRAIAEFLHEIAGAVAEGAEDVIADRLARWRRLDPCLLRAVLARHSAGREFPAAVQLVDAAR
ncbi:hypothetical protein [Neoroseomonas rubea]|uniref:hypothetical protein n=1 Tax=Neoroseomonas rubea TaxID=2748666 RepID=UPI0018E04948|nr:hypothetical protein [Roseomonas rubea]